MTANDLKISTIYYMFILKLNYPYRLIFSSQGQTVWLPIKHKQLNNFTKYWNFILIREATINIWRTMFHTSFNWWFFTEIWVTPCLQDSSRYSSSAVVQMVLFLPLISRSLSLFSRSLCTVPKALTTIGITVIFMFQFFQFYIRSKYLSFCFLFSL